MIAVLLLWDEWVTLVGICGEKNQGIGGPGGEKRALEQECVRALGSPSASCTS